MTKLTVFLALCQFGGIFAFPNQFMGYPFNQKKLQYNFNAQESNYRPIFGNLKYLGDMSYKVAPHEGDDKPCCYPAVWQGIMYRYVSTEFIEYFVTFYEDSTQKKLALDAVITEGESKTTTNLSQIIVTDDKSQTATVYQFDKAQKICQHQKFANVTYEQITERCIPDDASFFGSIDMGIPQGGASFNVRSFMWKPIPSEMPHLHRERLVSKNCAPVLEIVRGEVGPDGQKTNGGGANSMPVLQTDYYFNIATSIKDPSVFDLPSYCK